MRATLQPRIAWMNIGDLRAALRWPWDHTNGGKYAAKNDNGWINVSGRHWVHMTDYAKGQR